jgi:hypothetical protein
VLGTSAYDEPGTWNVGPDRNVLWEQGVAYDLQTLLDPVSGAGWQVTAPAGINNLGQIVGIGLLDGQPRVFVMTPM